VCEALVEERNTELKTCMDATSSTTNSILPGLGSKRGFHDDGSIIVVIEKKIIIISIFRKIGSIWIQTPEMEQQN
jgi:hypothetical protein